MTKRPSHSRDITGFRSGDLEAIQYSHSDGRRAIWDVRCDCGKVIKLKASELLKAKQKSCGCRKLERIGAANTKHGKSKHLAYAVWASMKARCLRTTHPAYARYGGRGISVCERWHSFELFLADMGIRPEGMTIDRIDMNGNYEPGNCRWETPTAQARNRRSSVFVEFAGERMTVSAWAERTGLERKTLEYRIRIGWTPERALTTASTINRKQ